LARPIWCDTAVTQRVEDTTAKFEAIVPDGWSITTSGKPNSFWRLSARSRDDRRLVEFYTARTDSDVELDELAANDYELLGNKLLGPVASRRILRKYLLPFAIEKSYGKNCYGEQALARYVANRTYGYIMVAYSRDGDLSWATPIFDSLKTHAPAMSFVPICREAMPLVTLAIGVPGVCCLGWGTRRYRHGLALCFALAIAMGFLLKCFGFDRLAWIGAPALILLLTVVGRCGIVVEVET
jgi:hypothetical protein